MKLAKSSKKHGLGVVLSAMVVSGATATGQTPTPNPTSTPTPTPSSADAATIAEFMKRVNAYVAIHLEAESASPKLPLEATPGHKTFPFETVLMVGDNIYGSERPQDYVYLLGEIFGDQLFFNAVTRSGQIVDSGIISRRQPEGKKADATEPEVR